MTRAIDFRNVSKYYSVRHERSHSLQELVVRLMRRQKAPSVEEYWILRDVSFTVDQGEIVGLIGANGAGKSSVLKLISKIIEPTLGEIEVHGRLSALLELGAGFHPDLTGRENVFLNGAILGLSDRVIQQRFDDIVAFAELERFIDVPVRHYSTGMFMRLGFSVAVHADPEVLLVDEVLSVGDQSFQGRCLDRIFDLVNAGAAALFVSHNMSTVRAICDRAIWLEDGTIQAEGHPDAVVNAYAGEFGDDDLSYLDQCRGRADPGRRHGSQEARITDVQLVDAQGVERYVYESGDSLTVRVAYECREPVPCPVFGLAVHRKDGWHINGPNTRFGDCQIDEISGRGHVDYQISALPLLEGIYRLSVSIYDHDLRHAYDAYEECVTFAVRNETVQEVFGNVYFDAEWSHHPLGNEVTDS